VGNQDFLIRTGRAIRAECCNAIIRRGSVGMERYARLVAGARGGRALTSIAHLPRTFLSSPMRGAGPGADAVSPRLVVS